MNFASVAGDVVAVVIVVCLFLVMPWIIDLVYRPWPKHRIRLTQYYIATLKKGGWMEIAFTPTFLLYRLDRDSFDWERKCAHAILAERLSTDVSGVQSHSLWINFEFSWQDAESTNPPAAFMDRFAQVLLIALNRANWRKLTPEERAKEASKNDRQNRWKLKFIVLSKKACKKKEIRFVRMEREAFIHCWGRNQ